MNTVSAEPNAEQDGIKLIPLPVREDDRGSLFEAIHNYDLAAGLFGQVYVVADPVRGTIRAFHKHAELWDYFTILHGSAKFVLVGEGGEQYTCTLSARQPMQLVVPPGVFHGWMSLEDDTILLSTASHLYNHQCPDEVRVPPDTFGDVWTVKGR